MDRIRTNWRLGTKDQSCNHFQGKCIEIHIGYKKETGPIVFRKRFGVVPSVKTNERQTGVVMNDLACQWKGCCQAYAEQFLGKKFV